MDRIFIFQFEKGYDRRTVFALFVEGKEFWHGTIDKMWAFVQQNDMLETLDQQMDMFFELLADQGFKVFHGSVKKILTSRRKDSHARSSENSERLYDGPRWDHE